MKEAEIKNKITKLKEKEAKQKDKVESLSKALDKAKNKYDVENGKLIRIQQDIQRCEGQLYKKAMADYGVESYEDLIIFLSKNLQKKSESDKEINE